MKKGFEGYTGRLGMSEERISELEDRSEESSNRTAKKNKRMKQNRTSKTTLLDGIFYKCHTISLLSFYCL